MGEQKGKGDADRPGHWRRPSLSLWKAATLTALVALALVTGCAPPSVRAALETIERIDRGTYGAIGAASHRGIELPKLVNDPTLEDYLKYAAVNNPGLRAAFEKWRAALERVPQVTALPEPKLMFACFIERVETRVGPQRYRVGVSQMFPWFGKLSLRGDVALAEAKAAYQRAEAVRLKLAFDVQDPYYELYYLGQAIAITKENMGLLKYIEAVARARYRTAGGDYSHVVRVQVELGKLDDQLRTMEHLKAPIAARLNAALNRPSSASVPFPKAIAQERLQPNDKEILTWLRDASPKLRELAAEIARQQAAIDLARKNYYPDFTLGLSYIDTGSARMPTSDSGKDPIVAEVGLTLPIWYGKYRAAEREAAARLRGARDSLDDRYNALSAQAELGLFKFRDAGRKIELFRDTLVPKAKQSLQATQTAYKAGKASIIDLIDAQRILLAFRLEHQRALANHAQRLAELEKLVGRELPRITVKPEAPPKVPDKDAKGVH